MFENEKKGWHGAYSISGKMTAEHFDEILRKDEICNITEEKKLKIKDFFEPDPEINNLDYLYNDIKSFQVYKKEDKNFRESLSKKIEKKEKNMNLDKVKIINPLLINKPKKNKLSSENIQYNPKYNFIFSKTLTGINWNKLPGRKKPFINIDINNSNTNYKKQIKEKYKEGAKTLGNKCLVDMDKYTKRGEFIELKDIRIKYDKPFDKKELIKIKESNNYIQNKSSSISSQGSNKKNKYPLLNLFINDNIKNKKQKILFEESKLTNNIKSKIGLKQSLSENIKVPDFKKYLSRQYFEKIRRKKGFEKNNYLSFLSLNYDLIREKKNSEIKFQHKINKSKIKKFIGIDSVLLTDHFKNIEKYNNHLATKVPNIRLMLPRAYCENIRNIKDKPSDCLSPSYSSFYKNSFNNIINLNLINSDIFEEKANDKVRKYVNKIKNKMRFNNKTDKQLIQENDLNKFDGITFKTFKRKHKEKK